MVTDNSKKVVREYAGHGKIVFNHGSEFECDFRSEQNASGTTTIICDLSLSQEFLRILDSEANKKNNTSLEASLRSSTSDGGKILVERMVLDKTSASFKPGYAKGTFIFIAFSEIEIGYNEVDDSSLVVTRWALVNFEFVGSESSQKNTPNRDAFTTCIGGYKFQFIQAADYSEQLDDLVKTGGPCITSQVELITNFGMLSNAYEVLIQSCWLFSFLKSNWIMPLYSDTYKNGKIVQSILYQNKMPYGFTKEKNAIDVHDKKFLLSDYIKTVYGGFLRIKGDFAINAVIEYYLSAIRQKTPEAKFSNGMFALECLASYAPKYADKNGDHLVSKDVEAKKQKIKNLKKRLSLNLDESSISEIAKEVAYDHIGLKDCLRYVFKKFDVHCDKKELDDLVAIHGQLKHTGRYDDLRKLVDMTDILFNQLVTTILRMLRYAGKISKIHY